MDPLEDGISHINIYSKGATWLGRSLSNFAAIGFTHPTLGKFASMEGFWYYVSTGAQFDELRELSGYKAKQVGKKLQPIQIREDLFRNLILSGIRCKLRQNSGLLADLSMSTLPLTHYYVYGGKALMQDKYSWITDEFTRIRSLMKTYLNLSR